MINSIIFSFLIILIIAVYYWRFYRKFTNIKIEVDDQIDSPPQDLSPAAMRYLMYADYDSDCLISAMVSASSKGAYGMIWKPNRFSIRLRNPSRFDSLSSDEKAALSLSRNNPVRGLSFESERNKFSDRADSRLLESLEKNYSHYLSPRKKYHQRGLMIGVFLFTFLIFINHPDRIILDIIFGCLLTGMVLASQWLIETVRDGWDWFFGLRDLILTISSLILLIYLDISLEPGIDLYYYLPIYLLSITAFWFMPRYTSQGAMIYQKIIAFRKYLKQSSKDELFQDNDQKLSYQLALGISSAATKPFESLLTKQTPPDNIDGLAREYFGMRRFRY